MMMMMMMCIDARGAPLPNKCLVWQAQCQLIKSHARTVRVRGEQGVLFFLTLLLTLFLMAH